MGRMSGVYIRGISMPKNCDECWKKYHGFGMVEHDEEWGTFWCKLAKGFCVDPRTKCPLVTVPPHGRFVDIEPFMRGLYEEMCMGGEVYTTKDIYEMFDAELNSIPTIIPADRKENP